MRFIIIVTIIFRTCDKMSPRLNVPKTFLNVVAAKSLADPL